MLAEARELVQYQKVRGTDRSYMEFTASRLQLADRASSSLADVHEWSNALRARQGAGFLPRDIGLALQLAERLEAHDELGQAIELLEELSQRRVAVTAFVAGYRWLELRARLADLYHRAARDHEAGAVEHELLQLLAVADPDLPLQVSLKNHVSLH